MSCSQLCLALVMKQNMAHKLLSSLQPIPRQLASHPALSYYLSNTSFCTHAPAFASRCINSHNSPKQHNCCSQHYHKNLNPPVAKRRNFIIAAVQKRCEPRNSICMLFICVVHITRHHMIDFLLFLSFDGVFCCSLHRFLLFSPALHGNWVVVISFFS